MKMTSRELVLALATVFVALFVGSFILLKPKIQQWQQLREDQKSVLNDIEFSKGLVDGRARWEGRYDKLREMIPQYPATQKMDIHWLSIMDRLADKHGVKISRRQAKAEKKYGLVYELPLEVKDWEGTLDAIVHFLYDLQAEGAMMDVRQLMIKPKGRGDLRGRFTLYCAYTRAKAPDTKTEKE